MLILRIEQGWMMTDAADEDAGNRSHRCTQRDLCWWHDVSIENVIKAELTHPVSACVFRIALRFLNNYLGWLKSR